MGPRSSLLLFLEGFWGLSQVFSIGKSKLQAYKQLSVYFISRPTVSKHTDKLTLAIASCLLWRAEAVW